MVGTLQGAIKALDNELEFIGSGYSRRAYRDGDVVYKVERAGMGLSCNQVEFEYYREIDRASLPAGFDIPEMSLFEVRNQAIIAAQYVEGDFYGGCWSGCSHDACYSLAVCDILYAAGFSDHSPGNVIKSGDTFFIVDLGC